MLLVTKNQYFLATLLFTFAAHTRSNGALLATHIFYPLIIHPLLFFITRTTPRPPLRIFSGVLFSGLILIPQYMHQIRGYMQYCLIADPQEWCEPMNNPNIYTHVQEVYWGITGPFSYWRISNLPNFLMAAPVVVLTMTFGFTFLLALYRRIRNAIQGDSAILAFMDSSTLIYTIPHILHLSGTIIVLLVMAHVQIVLRVLSASTPAVAWAVVWLILRDKKHTTGLKWGANWVAYALVWGAISTVLWASFLPPA